MNTEPKPPCPDCGRPKCVCDPFAYEKARYERETAPTPENTLSPADRDRREWDR
jgi:hypothetical protein